MDIHSKVSPTFRWTLVRPLSYIVDKLSKAQLVFVDNK